MTESTSTEAETKAKAHEKALGEFVIAFAMLAPHLLWAGFVVACLWSWFVVPLGVVAISTIHGAGLAVLWKLLAGNRDTGGDRSVLERSFESMLFDALLLGIGAGVHCFM